MVNPILHNIVEVKGDEIKGESSRTYQVRLEMAEEALSSHEVSARGRTASKDVKSTLKFWRQSMCEVRIPS